MCMIFNSNQFANSYQVNQFKQQNLEFWFAVEALLDSAQSDSSSASLVRISAELACNNSQKSIGTDDDVCVNYCKEQLSCVKGLSFVLLQRSLYLNKFYFAMHTYVYIACSGVLGGIRHIPYAVYQPPGFFWQHILTSVIINKQGTFRPFATPLCV